MGSVILMSRGLVLRCLQRIVIPAKAGIQ